MNNVIKMNKTILTITMTLALSLFHSTNSIAQTPYNISFKKLSDSGKVSNSTNIQRARWVVTKLTLDKKTFKLNIENYFQNDRRTAGFTGCASVKILSKDGDVLIEHMHSRGVNGRAFGGHRSTIRSTVDLSVFKDFPAALSIINIQQWHCSKGLWNRVKGNAEYLAKKGATVAGDVIRYDRAIKKALGH